MRFSSIMMTFLLTACGTEQSAAPSADAQRSDSMEQGDNTSVIHATVMTETLYRFENVLVVVENGNGPAEDRMHEAFYRFRKAAIELFKLDVVDEYNMWCSINEIRWDDELVPPIGGVYDPETAKLRLEYHGCIIDPPLYRLLATHYYHEMTGRTDLPDTVIQWAEDLSGANTILCAP